MRRGSIPGEYLDHILDLLVQLKNGYVNGVRVRLGRVHVSTAILFSFWGNENSPNFSWLLLWLIAATSQFCMYGTRRFRFFRWYRFRCFPSGRDTGTVDRLMSRVGHTVTPLLLKGGQLLASHISLKESSDEELSENAFQFVFLFQIFVLMSLWNRVFLPVLIPITISLI